MFQIVSQQMFQILHFPVGNPLNHGLKYGIFLLGDHADQSHVGSHMYGWL